MQEEQNSEEAPMNFDPDNPFYAQLFRYRYDTLTSEREKERDSLFNVFNKPLSTLWNVSCR